jgi:hypothetical protein
VLGLFLIIRVEGGTKTGPNDFFIRARFTRIIKKVVLLLFLNSKQKFFYAKNFNFLQEVPKTWLVM